MNIVFLSYEFGPEITGGIGTYVRHAAGMLRDGGHRVTVISATRKSARTEEWEGCTIVRLPCLKRAAFSEVAVPELVRRHQTEPFTLAEVPDLNAESQGLRQQLPALPIVYRSHTPLYLPSRIDFEGFGGARYLSALRRLLGLLNGRQSPRLVWNQALARCLWTRAYSAETDPERQAAAEADLIAPPSRRLAQRLQADWKIPSEKLRILPYPHQPDPVLLALPPGGLEGQVCFFGGIKYFKGLHTLAKAVPLVLRKHPKARFTLAGTTGTSPCADYSPSAFRRDAILAWKSTQECMLPLLGPAREQVEFAGFVPQNALSRLLKPSSIAVFPSLFDNFPNACLEAMSAARAIVATRSGGMEEMLVPGESGMLVEVDDHRGMARCISALLSEPTMASRLGASARARLCSEFSPAKILVRHEEIYREAVRRRAAACEARRL